MSDRSLSKSEPAYMPAKEVRHCQSDRIVVSGDLRYWIRSRKKKGVKKEPVALSIAKRRTKAHKWFEDRKKEKKHGERCGITDYCVYLQWF